MIDQMQLFPKTEKELGMEREEILLEEVLPKLRDAAESKKAKPEDIKYEILSSYSSLKFRTSVVFKLKLRGKKWYISVPARLQKVIPEGTKTTELASDKGYLRMAYNRFTDNELSSFMEDAVLLAIELVPKEFDCCSRFEACSDAKVCVHPDPAFSMLCGYRKILKSGRIFYGKNRNIDKLTSGEHRETI